MIANTLPTESIDFRGAFTSFLTPDDTINLITGEVKIAPWKYLMAPGSETFTNAVPSYDVFSTNSRGEMVIYKYRPSKQQYSDNNVF